MVGLEIGTTVHYSVQTEERTKPVCKPAIVLDSGSYESALLSVCAEGNIWQRKQATYMDRDGGHPGGTWHWIHGHNTMQGCREDLD